MSRHIRGLNFVDTPSVAWTETPDTPITGVSEWQGAVLLGGVAEIVATWSGPVPTVAGAGLVLRVPKVRGANATFTLSSLFTRLEVLPSNTTTFRCEKSSGGAAFSATTIASLSHTISDYEKTNSALTGTVTSGDLLRIYFVTMAGNGGAFEMQLQGAV